MGSARDRSNQNINFHSKVVSGAVANETDTGRPKKIPGTRFTASILWLAFATGRGGGRLDGGSEPFPWNITCVKIKKR